MREFEGLFGNAFEVSAFVEGTGGCPGRDQAWWLKRNRAFREWYAALTAEHVSGQPYEQTPYVVYTRFVGWISPPGSYGHLGLYEREIVVSELIDMVDTDLCGMDLPDLVLASYPYGWLGAQPSGCVPGGLGTVTLELCVANLGRQPSSSTWVALRGDGSDVERLRLCGLAAGETRCLAPVALSRPVSIVEVDADNEVAERFEDNNLRRLVVPTFSPPPTCTPLPPGRPSPTPLPTPTLQPCITPTATPTRDPRITDTPMPAATGIYLPVCHGRQP